MNQTAEPVTIPAVLFSDLMIREANTNKCTLIGIFNQWNCPKFPFQTPPFWVTAFIGNMRGVKEINITIRLEANASGHVLASLAANIRFPESGIPENAVIEIPLPVNSIVLPFPGVFRAVVLADDEKIAERGFLAIHTPIPAAS
jgi:hypothetical protein